MSHKKLYNMIARKPGKSLFLNKSVENPGKNVEKTSKYGKVREQFSVSVIGYPLWLENLENEPFSQFGRKSWKIIGFLLLWLEKLEFYFWA